MNAIYGQWVDFELPFNILPIFHGNSWESIQTFIKDHRNFSSCLENISDQKLFWLSRLNNIFPLKCIARPPCWIVGEQAGRARIEPNTWIDRQTLLASVIHISLSKYRSSSMRMMMITCCKLKIQYPHTHTSRCRSTWATLGERWGLRIWLHLNKQNT